MYIYLQRIERKKVKVNDEAKKKEIFFSLHEETGEEMQNTMPGTEMHDSPKVACRQTNQVQV